ncbi:magnesium transporter [Paludibacter jiangxiensis]|uniref:Magnesium transport protein CorA n=2 Tax=Paludibacter jiangxiensis TaxID=681398 RepID=A0A161LUH9_9BACT|nr:magnesium transporter [Paludibacter jiangxiensis]
MSKDIDTLKTIPLSNFIWIDLNDVAEEVEDQLEDFLKIYIQEEEEIEEIEISSRYIETADTIVANSKFLLDNYTQEAVSFILKNNILVSVRSANLKSFNETVKKLFANSKSYTNGYQVIAAILETRVEIDADMIEDTTQEITALSNTLKSDSDAEEDVLIAIKNLQEKTMSIREAIIDKQRVVSNMLKSNIFPADLKPKLTIIIKDINSLFEYTRFNFDRLDFLQDTFMGLVNTQQNQIIKIFTILTVIFMPPTLIASIYGMNFAHLPGSQMTYGFWGCIFLMVITVVVILFYFRWKKWL